ncbi:MAG: hypothetical protein ACLRMN_13255 [Mediterraneibacter gnavus]
MSETKQEAKVRKKAYRKARRKADTPMERADIFQWDHFHRLDSDPGIFIHV